jgi:hypothetical protein
MAVGNAGSRGNCRCSGRRDAARDLVTPVYGWFTEGFDTADLQAAKAFFEAPRS